MDSYQPHPEKRAYPAEALFDEIDDAVLVHELDGRIVDGNPAACRKLSYSLEEFRALNLRNLEPPSPAIPFEQRVREQTARGKFSWEGVLITKIGLAIPVDISSTVIQIKGRSAILMVSRDISRHKEFEQALLKSEERYRELFENANDSIYTHDLKGNLTSANKALERRTGYSRVELLGMNISTLVVAEQLEFARQMTRQKLAGGTNTTYEVDIIHKNGGRISLEVSTRVIYENGRPAGIQGICRDLTSRKKAENEIRKSNALLDSIFDNIPSMIFVKDAENLRFERVNKTFEKILGLKREDLVGKDDYAFFPKSQADFFTGTDREVLRNKEPIEIMEEEIRTKETWFKRVFHTRKVPILDEKGEPRYLLGISEEVTERKALEDTRQRYAEAQDRYARELESKNQELVESEKRYRQLTEASLESIIVVDCRGRVTLFNPAAERTFGYRAEEVVGKLLVGLIPLEFRDRHLEGFNRYVETREAKILGRTVEMRGRRKDASEFPMELSLSVIDVGGDLQFLGSISDLTERNRMRAMVVQTEKLASIGLLSAGVAHEINNPLAYVANNLVVLERDCKGLLTLLHLYEGIRDYLAAGVPEILARVEECEADIDLEYIRDNFDRILARTREGVARVSRIVQSMRGLARTDRPDWEEAHFPDLIDSSVEIIRGRMQRQGIQLELNYSETPKFRCVTTQVSQVILNLLVNALQAVETATASDQGRLRISTRQVDDSLVLEIEDNGGGIDPKDLSRIFDPFYTTKPVGEGTGMGLSISHGIVTAHGGRIEVDSRPGEGTCFRVFLPRDPQQGPS